MSSQDPRSKIYSFRTGQSNQPESQRLNDALASAVDGIAQSLQDEEELLLRQSATSERRRQLVAGLILLLVVVAAVLWLRSLRMAEVNEPSRIAANQHAAESQTTKPADAPRDDPQPIPLQTGDFLMKLPRGFEWDVRIIALGKGQYRMISQRQLNTLGIYQLQGNRLVMLEPDDKRLTEFQWLVTSNNQLELIAEPPAAKTGARYLGTTLTRKLEAEQPS